MSFILNLLVVSSDISALVFSRPLNMLLSVPAVGTVKKATASHIHNSQFMLRCPGRCIPSSLFLLEIFLHLIPLFSIARLTLITFPSASVVDIYTEMRTEHEVQLLFSLDRPLIYSGAVDAVELRLCRHGWQSELPGVCFLLGSAVQSPLTCLVS